MSLREGLRGEAIASIFGLTPHDDDFWPIWQQFVAIENGWA